MKKFTCFYLDSSGSSVRGSKRAITAENEQSAADLYSKEFPTRYPSIRVERGLKKIDFEHSQGPALAQRIEYRKQQEKQKAKQNRRELEQCRREKEAQQLLVVFDQLSSSIKSADGDLSLLAYDELVVLIENLRDFPRVRNKLSAQEYAVREELYKAAFFDSNLQIGLQAQQSVLQVELLRDLKSILTGEQSGTSGKPGGKSNLAQNAALLGGAAALQKLNQIEENTGDVSEGLGFD